MYPGYGCMDLYPQPGSHPKNHIPSSHHYCPTCEAVPPQMKIDPFESPVTFNSWPCNDSFGYPSPAERHGCSNHGYPPGYYSFRPPHSHPSPSPLYYYGPYPPCSDTYPAYIIPQHFPADQARYEYGKNRGIDHFCCCPSHARNHKSESNVKIEEEKPDAEQKNNDFAGPIKAKNQPYPIFWLPPGYTKDKETNRGLDPKSWNGWVPFDLNSMKPWKHGGEEQRAQNQEAEERKSQFPFPIIWMPSYDKYDEVEKKELKDIDVNPNLAGDLPKFKIIPVKLLENGVRGDKLGVAEDTSVKGVSSASVENKSPPESKKWEESKEKELSETKARSIPVKQIEQSKEEKSPENNAKKPSSSAESTAKRQSSSPEKASKLPPVCLRLDPLPRKKNGNGTSRLPSPPRVKDGVPRDSKATQSVLDKAKGEESNEETKDVEVQEKTVAVSHKRDKEGSKEETKVVGCGYENAGEVESEKKEIKVVEVQERKSAPENKDEEGSKEKEMLLPEAERRKALLADEAKQDLSEEKQVTLAEDVEGKMTISDEGDARTENEAQSQARAPAKVKGVGNSAEFIMREEMKDSRKELSSEDAAVLIQSAYRGYDVRKWKPLKKLQQIASVREKVGDVREKICSLEASSKPRNDDKQRLLLSETIMNLLLRLDTIQGLHPSIREVRKSVAKELVCLQEKLDSLVDQTTSGLTSAETVVAPVEMSEDHHGAFEDATSSMQIESSSDSMALVNATIDGNDSVKAGEVLELPIVDKEEPLEWKENEGLVPKQQQCIGAPSTAPEHEGEGPESKKEQSRKDIVEHVPSAKECTNSEESAGSVKDENIDSSMEGLMESTERDETSDTAEKMAEEALQVLKDREPAWKMDEFTELPSQKECQVSHEELPVENGELNLTQEESEEAISAKDSKKDFAVGELIIESSERNQEPESQAGEHSIVKDEEPISKSEGATELPLVAKMGTEYGMEAGPAGESVTEITQITVPVQDKDSDSNQGEPAVPLDVSVSDLSSRIDVNIPPPDFRSPGVEKVDDGSARPELENAERVVKDMLTKDNKHHAGSMELVVAESESPMASREVGLPPKEVGMSKPSDSEIVDASSVVEYSPAESQSAEEERVVAADKDNVSREEDEKLITGGGPELWEAEKLTVSADHELRKEDQKDPKPVDENEKLKDMLENLLEVGKQQLLVMSDLNLRVRDLERKLAKKKKLKVRRQAMVVPPSIKTIDG